MRFGPDPRITIPASGLRKRRNQGLTEDRTRSPVQKVRNPLASRAATTEVLTLEQLVPAIVEAMKKRAEAVKARRIQDEKRKQEWADAEELRKDRERQARVDGYRIAFLQRQI